MLQHDRVVGEEKGLLPLHVHVEVGIGLVEVLEGHALEPAHPLDEAAVDPGLVEGGVGEEDEDSGHLPSQGSAGPRPPATRASRRARSRAFSAARSGRAATFSDSAAFDSRS